MLAVLLALGAAVSWGTADFIAGVESRRVHLLAVLLASQASGLVLVGAVVAVRGEAPPPGEALAFATLAGLAGTAALAAFYRGLSIGAMAVVTPIAATSSVIPLVVGIASGERPSAVQLAGVAVALVGVVLAAREHGERERRAAIAAGTGLALAAAAGFGCFFLALDRASDGDVLWATLVTRVTSVTALGLVVLALRPALGAGRPRLPLLAVVGALDVSANALFAFAASTGLVSLASVLASLYPVVVIALARFVLHERVHRLQQAGAAGALAGVVLISAG